MTQLLDLDRLFRLRVVVARLGEMDNAEWWNSHGQLGEIGVTVLKRGFPRTYRFAAAKSVFAIAAARCREIFNPPKSFTLWSLPAAIEDQFDGRWESWIDRREEFELFFDAVAAVKGGSDVAAMLREHGLIGDEDEERVKALKRSAEGCAVQIPGVHVPSDEIVTQLALAFSKGQKGALAVPYARLEE